MTSSYVPSTTDPKSNPSYLSQSNCLQGQRVYVSELFQSRIEYVKLLENHGAIVVEEPSQPEVIYLVSSFSGPDFDRLLESGFPIVGIPCLASSILKQKPLPTVPDPDHPLKFYPIFGRTFEECVILLDGFRSPILENLSMMIRLFCGRVESAFVPNVTHLITETVTSHIYQQAIQNGIPIVRPQWLYDIWENVALLSEDNYNIPCFFNLVLFITGYVASEKCQLSELIKANGGRISQVLNKHCTHLVTNHEQDYQEYVSTRKWNIKIVDDVWCYECIKRHQYIEKSTGWHISPNPITDKSVNGSQSLRYDESQDHLNHTNEILNEIRTHTELVDVDQKHLHCSEKIVSVDSSERNQDQVQLSTKKGSIVHFSPQEEITSISNFPTTHSPSSNHVRPTVHFSSQEQTTFISDFSTIHSPSPNHIEPHSLLPEQINHHLSLSNLNDDHTESKSCNILNNASIEPCLNKAASYSDDDNSKSETDQVSTVSTGIIFQPSLIDKKVDSYPHSSTSMVNIHINDDQNKINSIDLPCDDGKMVTNTNNPSLFSQIFKPPPILHQCKICLLGFIKSKNPPYHAYSSIPPHSMVDKMVQELESAGGFWCPVLDDAQHYATHFVIKNTNYLTVGDYESIKYRLQYSNPVYVVSLDWLVDSILLFNKQDEKYYAVKLSLAKSQSLKSPGLHPLPFTLSSISTKSKTSSLDCKWPSKASTLRMGSSLFKYKSQHPQFIEDYLPITKRITPAQTCHLQTSSTSPLLQSAYKLNRLRVNQKTSITKSPSFMERDHLKYDKFQDSTTSVYKSMGHHKDSLLPYIDDKQAKEQGFNLNTASSMAQERPHHFQHQHVHASLTGSNLAFSMMMKMSPSSALLPTHRYNPLQLQDLNQQEEDLLQLSDRVPHSGLDAISSSPWVVENTPSQVDIMPRNDVDRLILPSNSSSISDDTISQSSTPCDSISSLTDPIANIVDYDSDSLSIPVNIVDIQPRRGSKVGGNKVVVTLDRFLHDAKVVFGQVAAHTISHQTQPKLWATTPPSAVPLSVEICIINSEGKKVNANSKKVIFIYE